MEDSKFDALARRLATRGLTRRQMVRVLGGTVAGGVLGATARDRASAAVCRQPGVMCAKDAHCCSGICGDDRRCACPDDLTLCQRECVDLQTTHDHCGDCATACADDQVCDQGGCCTPVTACPDGQNCGAASDTCGGTIPCGDCTLPETCGGGGTENVCGCTPQCDGKSCGDNNGCGGTCTACSDPSQYCDGQTCVDGQGTCPAGANECTTGTTTTCNGRDTCLCRVSTEGVTRCTNKIANSSNTDCVSTADCEAQHPNIPGIICVQIDSNVCSNSFCVDPCPA